MYGTKAEGYWDYINKKLGGKPGAEYEPPAPFQDAFAPNFLESLVGDTLQNAGQNLSDKRTANMLSQFYSGGMPSNADPNPGGLLGLLSGGTARAAQRRKKREAPETQDLLQQMLMELLGEADATGSVDYETALRNSNKQIRDAYLGDIGAIRGANQRARVDTRNDNAEIEAMYRALQQEYKRGAKAEIGQGERFADKIQAVANRTQNQVAKSANQRLEEQAALAKGLGVESALPEVAATQQNHLQQQIEKFQNRGQRDANDILQFSSNQQRYLNRGGHNARLEGTNRQADLLADLQDYLQSNRDKIAGLQGDMGRALAQNETAVGQSISQGASDAFDNKLDLLKAALGIEDTRADNQLNADKFRFSMQNPPSQAPANEYLNFLQQASGGQPDILQAIEGTMKNTPEFIQNQFKGLNGETLKMTPIEAANMLEDALVSSGIKDPRVLQQARIAAMNYFG